MPDPKISLIMTAYNRQAFIGMAIASVKAQTYPDWELIIWDDGSTDFSPQIASKYQQKDPRITLISSHHQGRVRSLKAAHALAKGEYLGWLDSDDLLHPNALELTSQILDNRPNIGLVKKHSWRLKSLLYNPSPPARAEYVEGFWYQILKWQ